MKQPKYLQLLGLACGIILLVSGCLLRPARVPTHYFILAPIPTSERAPATAQPPLVEVGFVKMPSYLLRDSIAVRKSPTEVEYLEDALWAERLDRSFRQTLAENLSMLLASNQVPPSASEHGGMKVSVDVKQFDVDTHGRGTLIAWWRLTLSGSDKPPKSGLTHLARLGPSPRGTPQAIATTLSALTTEFSQTVAQAARDAATR